MPPKSAKDKGAAPPRKSVVGERWDTNIVASTLNDVRGYCLFRFGLTIEVNLIIYFLFSFFLSETRTI